LGRRCRLFAAPYAAFLSVSLGISFDADKRLIGRALSAKMEQLSADD